MSKIRAINNTIIGIDGDFDDTVTSAGIVIRSNIGKATGIAPRWFRVHSVGPDIDWIQSGQWVLVDYGRWSENFVFNEVKHWRLDPNAISCVSDHKPETVYENLDAVHAPQKTC